MTFSEKFKERAVKIAVPFLMEKFEPAIINIALAKDQVILEGNEKEVVVILHLKKDNIPYSSTVVLNDQSTITRVLDTRPFKDLLMSLMNNTLVK